MEKHGRGARDGAGRQLRPRFGTKVATALATLSLMASMCPGAMALAYANGELAAGSGDLQPQDGEIVEDGYIIVDQNTHEMRDGAKYKVKENVEIKPTASAAAV